MISQRIRSSSRLILGRSKSSSYRYHHHDHDHHQPPRLIYNTSNNRRQNHANATMPYSYSYSSSLDSCQCPVQFEMATATAKRFSTVTAARDPTARRPSKVCDPYGQNGNPMSHLDASNYLPTLEKGWTLLTPTPQQMQTKDAQDIGTEATHARDEPPAPAVAHPTALEKEFYHANYMDGSRVAAIVAAVAHNNNHYPTITLERRLMKREKAWRVVTTVTCRTETLDGLSSHDFLIAMLIDVEVNREEVQKFILDDEDSFKKHI